MGKFFGVCMCVFLLLSFGWMVFYEIERFGMVDVFLLLWWYIMISEVVEYLVVIDCMVC